MYKMSSKLEKIKRTLQEKKIELMNIPYIHGVGLDDSIDKLAYNLMMAKKINVFYIYDLAGIVRKLWNPKSRFISTEDVETVDDVYIFITGHTRDEYFSITKYTPTEDYVIDEKISISK